MTFDEALTKVKKLLALSKSGNQNEAASAAAFAADIMARYQIEEAALQSADAPQEPVLGDNVIETSRSYVSWRGRVAAGLARSLNAYMYRDRGQIVVIGRASDANAIRYLHGLICSDIDRLTEPEWITQRHTTYETVRVWKNGFRNGAALTVYNRLTETAHERRRAQQADPGMTQALMVLDKRAGEIELWKSKLSLRAGPRSYTSSRSGYQAGREAGSRVNIGRNPAAGSLSSAPRALKG